MLNSGNILFVGVGGQGTISASNLLASALIDLGYDVKMSEVHGMAQRGGSVSTQVRYADQVHSPLIEKGTCDIIVSFEKSEAARWLDYLKKDGIIISSEHEIRPYSVNVGKEAYPENILLEMKDKGINVLSVDAQKEGEALGNGKAANMFLLGMLCKKMDLPEDIFNKLIREYFKPKLQEINTKAFMSGFSRVQ